MEDQYKKIGGDVMIEPKDKVKQLIDKFIHINGNNFFAKECALLLVDEILKSNPCKYVFFLDYQDCTVLQSDIKYWQEVKSEIEKL